MAPFPGWHPNPDTNDYRWWDGSAWVLDHPRTEDEELRGVVAFSLRGADGASLTVYEKEAWMFPAAGRGSAIGGSIAGATAEVVIQNQIGSRRWKGSTLLHVRATTFDFSFNLSEVQSKKPAELQRLNQVAGFINNRSLALAPVADPAAPAGGASVADELAKLATLRDQGILTDAEFQAQKTKLLG